jgi:tetratricopeptide (TPR) repeat protein
MKGVVMQKSVSNSLLATALAAVLSLSGMVASGAEPQALKPKVSLEHGDAFRAMGEALAAKRYGDVDASAKSVLASPKKTKDDVYAAQQYLFYSAQARNDVPGQINAIEAQLASGFVPPAAQGPLYSNLIALAYKVPDYKKAIEYGQQLIKLGGAGPEVNQFIGQAYYQLKDYKSAVGFFENLVSETEKKGRRPARDELIWLQQSYGKAGNKDAARETLQKVVRFYPDPATWALLIHDIKRAQMDSRQKLHLYRLMALTGNLKTSDDYFSYYNAAMAAKLVAESESVLAAAFKGNVFTDGGEKARAERYLKSAHTEAAMRKGELPKLESEARAAGTGDPYVALGMMRYSFGEYGPAVEAVKAGIAKGKLSNAADAQMVLGLALLKAGQKGEALKAFRAAESNDEVTHRISELWALYSS